MDPTRDIAGAGAVDADPRGRGASPSGRLAGGYNQGVHVQVTRSVAADVETLWGLLADVQEWPSWTRSVSSVTLDGPFEVGTVATLRQPQLPAIEWRILELVPGRSFAWESVVAGTRTVAHHEVAPAAAGTSTLTITIDQRGALAGPMRLLAGRRTKRYLRMEAEGLAAAAEAAAR